MQCGGLRKGEWDQASVDVDVGGAGLHMACRVAHSPVVKLWMASQSICKVPLERWGSFKIWSNFNVSLGGGGAEDVGGCWRIQMPAIAFERLRSWSHNPALNEAARSVISSVLLENVG